MPVFPSIDWFDSVRSAANSDRQFRALGSCDAKVGLRVDEQIFVLEFEAFECSGASEGTEDALLDVDFSLSMGSDAWKSLLENIRTNGAADSEHTFNTLDIEHGIVESPNAYGTTSFLRYHLTLQRLFDLSAEVETTFV